MVEPREVKMKTVLYFVCMLRCQFMLYAIARFIISNCRFIFMVLFLSFDLQYTWITLHDSFVQNKNKNKNKNNQREHTRSFHTHYSFIYIFFLFFSYFILQRSWSYSKFIAKKTIICIHFGVCNQNIFSSGVGKFVKLKKKKVN